MSISCPKEGSFMGYKYVSKVDKRDMSFTLFMSFYPCYAGPQLIAVLEIPEDAKRVTNKYGQSRCDKAKVLRFEDFDGNVLDITEAYTCMFNGAQCIKYTIGDVVYADSFDENPDTTENGIYFFMSKEECIDKVNEIREEM